MRTAFTRFSLSTLVLLAGLALALAALASPVPARTAASPARAAPGPLSLTAYSAPSRVAVARSIARTLVSQHHWSVQQYRCLVQLWNRESGWSVYASNPSSGAYGIPQALPGRKMARAGPHWRTSARTQIRWGLGYIKSRYGSPCGAWRHSNAYGWY
jgi:hypothetical protein